MDFENKKILITGNGTFAQSLISQLLKTDIKEIRVFSRNENKQWETAKTFNDSRLSMIIGDIKDYKSIVSATRGVNYVIHSAALKHVSVCEKQPIEAIQTNVIGAMNVMLACTVNCVTKLVCLSTDKSANASTCYGATKYLMERLAIGIDHKDTDIVITRYGNVLGSSGSVVPLFKKLKSENKPLTITDPNMTRFVMPIEESVGLVLYALENGKHGDLFTTKNKTATVQMIADCISSDQIIIGRTKAEKTDEALLTKIELNHSEDSGKYYRVNENITNPIIHTQSLTSDNAERFELEELRRLVDEC
jgi:UDP-N-acetylglucosamine 4,6-dehydratase